MQLFRRDELTQRAYVTQSAGVKCGIGQIALKVGVRLQDYGRLFRKNMIKWDGVDIANLRAQLGVHNDEVMELVTTLQEVIDWCEARRESRIQVDVDDIVTFSKVTLHDWPTMFYAVHSHNRITIHMYGRDLRDAQLGFRLNRADSYRDWKKDVTAITSNFWKHVEEVEAIRMVDILDAPKP